MISEKKEVADLDKFNEIIKECIRKRKDELLATGQNREGGNFQLAVLHFLRIL